MHVPEDVIGSQGVVGSHVAVFFFVGIGPVPEGKPEITIQLNSVHV